VSEGDREAGRGGGGPGGGGGGGGGWKGVTVYVRVIEKG
jgi:hypothetical protein